ncbi:hypothetical protein EJC49_09135 [Aquibium carbonis]|uniref:Uncharacterized protein n=1 Tax=Aquibium carbonis TaxID=2495581 RepID=A0A429YZ32_9HYPH|nr:hypothetical protein [Aquibium carbonis]RST86725.1 hypothetical protein EJC49_09135 [Aquibium carbonis]
MRSGLKVFLLAALAVHPGTAAATTYYFSVACPTGRSVEAWVVGDIDPGREYLRVATGINNEGCSISDASDFDKQTYPIKELRGWEAAYKAVPLVGPLLWDWFWN